MSDPVRVATRQGVSAVMRRFIGPSSTTSHLPPAAHRVVGSLDDVRGRANSHMRPALSAIRRGVWK